MKLNTFRRREHPPRFQARGPDFGALGSALSAGKARFPDPWLIDDSTRPLTHAQSARTASKMSNRRSLIRMRGGLSMQQIHPQITGELG